MGEQEAEENHRNEWLLLQDEKALIRRASQRNQTGEATVAARSAWNLVVGQHRDAIVSFCYKYIGPPPDDAEDAANIALSEAFRSLPGFRGDAKLRTWLLSIAKKSAFRILSDRKKRNNVALDSVGECFDVENDPGGENAQWKRTIRDAVAALPQDYRLAIELYYGEELSLREIAHLMGISEKAVKMLLFRARRKLESSLG